MSGDRIRSATVPMGAQAMPSHPRLVLARLSGSPKWTMTEPAISTKPGNTGTIARVIAGHPHRYFSISLRQRE